MDGGIRKPHRRELGRPHGGGRGGGGTHRGGRGHQHRGPPPPPPPPPPPQRAVDRERTCPLLVRCFLREGGHHKQEDYAVRGQEPVDAEVHVHTWMNATLRELSDLIKEVNSSARGRNSQLSLAVVYPDRRGVMVLKEVGIIHALRHGPDDQKTLEQLQFQAGDFLDCAVLTQPK